jgi:hypothetical protein
VTAQQNVFRSHIQETGKVVEECSLSRRFDVPEGAYMLTTWISPTDIAMTRPDGILDRFVVINVLRRRKPVLRREDPIL